MTTNPKYFSSLTGTLLLLCGMAGAQDKPAGYPTRPIRIIVAVQPGAGGDVMARAAAQMLSDKLGQSAVVDNRPGAGGLIATELVARAAPDGYTLLSQGESVMIQGAMKRLPVDIMKALDPVVSTSTQPYIMVAHPSLPATNLKELTAYAQANSVTYSGGAGLGGTVHLGVQQFVNRSGIRLNFVPYKGSAPAITAVMGGEIHLAAGSSIAAASAIRTGKVRAFANLGPARIPAFPDLPTFAEQGYPGFKLTNHYYLWAPAGTPAPIVNAINRIVGEGMHTPAMVQKLAADGSQPAERAAPPVLRKSVMRDYAEVEQSVRQMNLKL
jgi:tripartite-type tricarboxylate transporter receptor subunit TctC